MDKEITKWLAIGSIVLVLIVLLALVLSGVDISGIEIHKGIKIR